MPKTYLDILGNIQNSRNLERAVPIILPERSGQVLSINLPNSHEHELVVWVPSEEHPKELLRVLGVRHAPVRARDLEQSHVNELGADFHSLVEHVMHALFDLELDLGILGGGGSGWRGRLGFALFSFGGDRDRRRRSSYCSGSRITNSTQCIDQVEGVPCVTLDIRCQALDGGTCVTDVVNRDDSPARKTNEVERVVRQAEQSVEQVELIECVGPVGPESTNRGLGDIAGSVGKDGNEELERGGIDTSALGSVKSLKESIRPVDFARLNTRVLVTKRHTVIGGNTYQVAYRFHKSSYVAHLGAFESIAG